MSRTLASIGYGMLLFAFLVFLARLRGSAFRELCRGKHVSAAIIVLAGAVLLLGGSFIRHGDTRLFIQVLGCAVGAFGLAGWMLSSARSSS